MIEVQIVRRSREGVVIPIGRTASPVMVRKVAECILRDRAKDYGDELLNEVALKEQQDLRDSLAAEGIRCIVEKK